MMASIEPDPAPPGQSLPASGLVLKGNVQLVLSQAFFAPGKLLKDTNTGALSRSTPGGWRRP